MTANEVKAIRERLELSQTAMASKLDMLVDTYRKYEYGIRTVPEGIASLLRSLDASGGQ